MVSENNGDEHGNFKGTGATITLAATLSLFGIILVFIVIYFYVKHHLRNQHRARQQNLLHRISTQITHANVNSTTVSLNSGLDPQVIASMPKLLYKETNHFIQGEVTECSVCLGTILEDETVRVLPNCNHMFHVNCVDEWFTSHSTCPVCRAAVEPKVQQPGDDDQLAAAAQVQPTAPSIEEGDGVSSDDANHELGCSGLRIASFPRIVVSRERSLRRSSDGSSAVEDVEKQ